MNERETEARLRDWLDAQQPLAVPDDLRWSVGAIPATAPLGWTERAAATLGWRATAVTRVAWVVLLVGLLLALVVGGLVVGARRPDHSAVVVPTPMPTMTVVDEASDILATTGAKPLPPQATCPPGSDPDAPGAVGQDRPTGGPSSDFPPDGASLAFDRHAGRIVLWDGSQTWTYDVCDNTWQQMHPALVPGGAGRLVYDADSDRTAVFVEITNTPGTTPYETWSYDLVADRWTKVGSFSWPGDDSSNPTHGTIFYHDPSGLVVIYDGADMWAYDVDTNTLTKVRQRPDPALPAGSGLPRGRIAFGYDAGRDLVVAVVVPPEGWSYRETPKTGIPGETWTFDPRTGYWRREAAPAPSDLIVCRWWSTLDCWPTDGRAVFDGASGLTVFFNRDNHRTGPDGYDSTGPEAVGRIDAYDVEQGAWRTLREPLEVGSGMTPTWCESTPPVYDSLNRRIVCLADSDKPLDGTWSAPFAGVWSFSSVTGESRWLLEPDTAARCEVWTLAGKGGEAGAVDGTGAAARFSEPHSIVNAGELYVTDTGNHAIRKLTTGGTVTTIAGALGEPGFSDGVGAAARFDGPTGIASGGNVLYIADTGNDAIRRIAPDGTVTTLAKDLGISPVGIAVDPRDTVYAGGLQGNVILRIAPDGTVTTLAGARGQPGRTDGQGAAARFGAVIDIEGTDGADLVVVDLVNDFESALRMVAMDGTVTTTPVDWAKDGRSGAIEHSGDHVVSTLDHTVMDRDLNGTTLLAGAPHEAGYQDGGRDAARFRGPTDIVDGRGVLYVVDSGNHVIRVIAGCEP